MKIYLVGGAVRDKLLHLPIEEKDYVVVGATISDMLALGYKQVGKEFPVFLHPKTADEYALARMERKVKPGYTGFEFDTSPDVTLKEDLQRRDLTINAMAWDLENEKLIDPFGGQQDLEKKILRHVSSAFAEDPVRILRVGRFLARFAHLGFHVDDKTILLMQEMVARGEVNALVAERVWKELERALAEDNPDKFFDVLEMSHALSILFPQLSQAGRNALNHAIKISASPLVRFAALLHAYPDASPSSAVKKSIIELCERYRLPNQYRELAILTALHYQEALTAQRATTEELLQLFSALDIFRRETRFKNFLLASFAIAQSQKKIFSVEWLSACAQAVRDINVQAIIAQGFNGQALATKLNEERLQKLTTWLTQNRR